MRTCTDDHQLKKEDRAAVGELSSMCAQIVVACFYLGRVGRLEMLWIVHIHARAVTKRYRACDQRLASLIKYTHCAAA